MASPSLPLYPPLADANLSDPQLDFFFLNKLHYLTIKLGEPK